MPDVTQGLGHDGNSMVYVQLGQGRIFHISEFAKSKPTNAFPYNRRSEARCAYCGETVYVILGRERAHHARHAPGAGCAYSASSETQRHFDMKYFLQMVLQRAAAPDAVLKIKFPCRGYIHQFVDSTSIRVYCSERLYAEKSEYLYENFVIGWDDAKIEQEVDVVNNASGKRRIDVGLLREGMVLAALEVHHTNEVTFAKGRELESAGVSWLEIDVNKLQISGPYQWKIDKPLFVTRYGPRIDVCCPGCQKEREKCASRHDSFLALQDQENKFSEELKIVDDKVRILEKYVGDIENLNGRISSLEQKVLKNASELYVNPDKFFDSLYNLDDIASILESNPRRFGRLKFYWCWPLGRLSREIINRMQILLENFARSWEEYSEVMAFLSEELTSTNKVRDEEDILSEIKTKIRNFKQKSGFLNTQLKKLRGEIMEMQKEDERFREGLPKRQQR